MTGLLDGMNNPLMGMALGLLSGADPGGTFASGAQQGLINMQAMSRTAMDASLIKARLEEFEREKKERESEEKAWGGFLGNQGTPPTPYQMSPDELMPGEAPIPGLMNAGQPPTGLYETDPKIASLLSGLPPSIGQQLIGNIALEKYKGTDPTSAQQNLISMGYTPGTPEFQAAMGRYMFKPDTSITIPPMEQPFSLTDLERLRGPNGEKAPVGLTPSAALARGYTIVETKTPEQAGKIANMQVAQAQLPLIDELLFTEQGEPNWTNINNAYIGTPKTQGRELAALYEVGIQAITRAETGAAMPPSDVESTRKRFQPSPMDKDSTVRIKTQMYEDFISGNLKLLDDSGKFNNEKFDSEFRRRRLLTPETESPAAPVAPGQPKFLGFEEP